MGIFAEVPYSLHARLSRRSIAGAFDRSGVLHGTVPTSLASADADLREDIAAAIARGECARPAVESLDGVRQGDPLGPVLFSLAYHPALVRVAAAYPDCQIGRLGSYAAMAFRARAMRRVGHLGLIAR